MASAIEKETASRISHKVFTLVSRCNVDYATEKHKMVSMKNHKWGSERPNGDQLCEHGCGYIRCGLVPYSVHSTKPVSHYKKVGLDERGRGYRFSVIRPPCVPIVPFNVTFAGTKEGE